ncbi:Fic family protein [Verrucomicrobium sp. 3C]|uniref:Fic family protein n=1 Tax=Verrucomicrobium sp. 3C TaxID=1134055 RepID=UPI000371C174|nr:Fic family protein [Verrucomicrobium sp. 3C]
MYIWEEPDWPAFRFDDAVVRDQLSAARLKQGRLLGAMSLIGSPLSTEAQAFATTEEIVSNSEIEGEKLDKESVRSYVARRLGFEASARFDRRAEGAAEIALDAAKNYQAPLMEERLFGWHAALFPGGYSGMDRIRTGAWRDDARGPMVIVSGPIGREKIHFQSPPAARIPKEMERFLDWFNREQSIDGILKTGLAHLWFVMIHPFEDGNGRIARTITDMALARSENSDKRFCSLSGQILKERKAYYASLEDADRGGLDATRWLSWFLDCFSRAVDGAQEIHCRILNKARFWMRHSEIPLNERQKTVLNRYLDGFKGHLTARKWATLAKCSLSTAERDIAELIGFGVLSKDPGGSKNTSFSLRLPEKRSL